MKRLLATAGLLLLLCAAGDAELGDRAAAKASPSGFPQTVRVRLWYLHPAHELRVRADAGRAQMAPCASCKTTAITTATLRAAGSKIEIEGNKSPSSELRISGTYQMNATGDPPIRADFPIEIRASEGRLLVTALLPMEEYIAGVLAGETGNFKSDEALKAMAVAARSYAMHFGSRHALEGFDFCDTTHCQDLRIAGIDAHLRSIADATAGEVLWYDGEPAATYYHANCGGATEDGHFVLGNNEPRAPFLVQHSDQYCVRNGSTQWRTEVSKRELQRALAADGVIVPGTLRTVSVLHRTPSGRVEFLRVTGSTTDHRAGAELSLRHRPPHWMGAHEEQLVRRERRRRPSHLSWPRIRARSWLVPGGRRGDGRGRSFLSRNPQLLLSGDASGRRARRAYRGSNSPTKTSRCLPRVPIVIARSWRWRPGLSMRISLQSR